MKVDLDLLHETVEKQRTPGSQAQRGGHTFALMMQLVGYLQLGVFDTICVGCRDSRHAKFFCTGFIRLLKDVHFRQIEKHERGIGPILTITYYGHTTEVHFIPACRYWDFDERQSSEYLYMQDHAVPISAQSTFIRKAVGFDPYAINHLMQ